MRLVDRLREHFAWARGTRAEIDHHLALNRTRVGLVPPPVPIIPSPALNAERTILADQRSITHDNDW